MHRNMQNGSVLFLYLDGMPAKFETATGKKIKFGSMLTEERRRFVAGAIRRALLSG